VNEALYFPPSLIGAAQLSSNGDGITTLSVAVQSHLAQSIALWKL